MALQARPVRLVPQAHQDRPETPVDLPALLENLVWMVVPVTTDQSDRPVLQDQLATLACPAPKKQSSILPLVPWPSPASNPPKCGLRM